MPMGPRMSKPGTFPVILVVLLSVLAFAPAPIRAAMSVDEPSLEAFLDGFANFEHGRDDALLLELRDRVREMRREPAAAAACERALLEFIVGRVTAAARRAACDELRLIGTERSVPTLEAILADPEASDAALAALGSIPGAAADRALLRGLSSSRGRTRLGLISALGLRDRVEAIAPLERILGGGARGEASAAAEALAAIGGRTAARALAAATVGGAPDVRRSAAWGLLVCADRLLASGDPEGAAEAFDVALRTSPELRQRQAAFRGAVRSAGPAGPGLLIQALSGGTEGMVDPAIDLVPSILDATTVSQAAGSLGALPKAAQVRLITALGSFEERSVAEALIGAAAGPDMAIRIAALEALGRAGGPSSVGLLAERAAHSTGAEKAAARESLGRIFGPGVDEAVIEGARNASDEGVRCELVRALGERGARDGKPLLLDLAASGRPSIRQEAVRAFSRLAGGADLDSLLDLLPKAAEGFERDEVARAAAAVALRFGRPGARAEAIVSRLSSEDGFEERAELLGILGMIGEDETLPIVRSALVDPRSGVADAAVRALAAWPTATARDDALRVAKESPLLVHRVLALQGYVRMIGLEAYRAPEAAIGALAGAMAVAERPEEKRLVLAALPTFACPEALALAGSFEEDADLAAEARAAAALIRERLLGRVR